MHRVILAGFSTCLLALTLGFSPTAFAEPAAPTCRTPQVEARIKDLNRTIKNYDRLVDAAEEKADASQAKTDEGYKKPGMRSEELGALVSKSARDWWNLQDLRETRSKFIDERARLEALPPCPPPPPKEKPRVQTESDQRLMKRLRTGARPGSGEKSEERAEVASWTSPFGGWSYGLSGALTYPHTDFIDRGSASGSAGALCADVSKDIWGSSLRYAGEFSGFRIAATASACQGFGTATQFVPLGGFDGKTSFGTFFTAGGRLEIPLNLSGLRIIPFAGVGGAYAHVKVEAFPFESNSSWRPGTYWEVGGAVPVPPKFFGMGTVQGIDAVSAEVYASFKRIGVGHQTLDGGAPTKTDLDMIMGGARIKY